jgi:enoyl-CoA hydratase/carnithine racemase
MALACRMVQAAEAKEWGLVNHLVERDKLLETALEMARGVAGFPPRSGRLNKRLIMQSLNLTLNDCLELFAAYQAIVQSTADQKEAVAALLEKRARRYTGL